MKYKVKFAVFTGLALSFIIISLQALVFGLTPTKISCFFDGRSMNCTVAKATLFFRTGIKTINNVAKAEVIGYRGRKSGGQWRLYLIRDAWAKAPAGYGVGNFGAYGQREAADFINKKLAEQKDFYFINKQYSLAIIGLGLLAVAFVILIMRRSGRPEQAALNKPIFKNCNR